MSKVIEITNDTEFDDLIKGSLPVAVDFYATWCNPCKMQAPIFHEFAESIGDKAKTAKLDVDVNEKIAIRYSIASIPTIAIFKGGELVEKSVGLTSKAQLAELMIKYL